MASRMTLDSDNLFSKSIYSNNTLLNVGKGTLLPIVCIGPAILVTKQCPLSLKNVLYIPNFSRVCFLLDSHVRITIIMLFLTLLMLVSKTTPQVMLFYRFLVWVLSILPLSMLYQCQFPLM